MHTRRCNPVDWIAWYSTPECAPMGRVGSNRWTQRQSLTLHDADILYTVQFYGLMGLSMRDALHQAVEDFPALKQQIWWSPPDTDRIHPTCVGSRLVHHAWSCVSLHMHEAIKPEQDFFTQQYDESSSLRKLQMPGRSSTTYVMLQIHGRFGDWAFPGHGSVCADGSPCQREGRRCPIHHGAGKHQLE